MAPTEPGAEGVCQDSRPPLAVSQLLRSVGQSAQEARNAGQHVLGPSRTAVRRSDAECGLVPMAEKRARTNIAMLHEEGHAEPWIIALPEAPATWRAYDYGLRWGIEAMFSGYKTRGFNLEDSQIGRTDRLDRLVLVLSLALYWAVSTGMWDAMANKRPAEKKPRRRNAKTLCAA